MAAPASGSASPILDAPHQQVAAAPGGDAKSKATESCFGRAVTWVKENKLTTGAIVAAVIAVTAGVFGGLGFFKIGPFSMPLPASGSLAGAAALALVTSVGLGSVQACRKEKEEAELV